jgi:hypothetical protein
MMFLLVENRSVCQAYLNNLIRVWNNLSAQDMRNKFIPAQAVVPPPMQQMEARA